MSARDEVLAAVRAALGAGSEAAAAGLLEDPGPGPGPRAATAGAADAPVDAAMLTLFAERVADYRATVTRCAAADLEAAIVTALEPAASVVVPAGCGFEVPGAVVDAGLSAGELDAVEAVVTTAAVAIAETGTIVLDHGEGQGRRALTLLPDLHVCVVYADQVVPEVGVALGRLDPLRPQTWVSGPSATSDIELNRVEGVHGPRRLHLILVTG